MTASRKPWFVLRATPGREAALQRLLRGKGIECALPMEARWRLKSRHQKAKTMQEFPLAPGYLFVRLRRADLWRALRLQGVVCALGVRPGQTAALNDGDVAWIVERARRPAEEQRYMLSGREYRPGDAVEVIGGPLRGETATVESIAGDRAVILLAMLGARRAVEISAGMAAKA